MKKKFSIGMTILVLGALGYSLYKSYKSGMKKLEEQEEKKKKDIKSMGMSEAVKKYTENVIPGDDSLIQALYMSFRFNDMPEIKKRVENGLVDIDKSFLSRRVIHVGMRTNDSDKDHLVFMFEIPRIYDGDYKSPRVKDYVFALQGAFENIKELIGDTGDNPVSRRCLEGRFILKIEKEGKDPRFESVVIPRSYYEYEGIQTSDWASLYNYIEKIRTACNTYMIAGNPDDFRSVDGENIEDQSRIKSSVLYYKMEFPIESRVNGVKGINLKTAFMALEYLTNEKFKIIRSNNVDNIDDADTYIHIIFHGLTEGGNMDMLSYFEYDEEDKKLYNDSIIY